MRKRPHKKVLVIRTPRCCPQTPTPSPDPPPTADATNDNANIGLNSAVGPNPDGTIPFLINFTINGSSISHTRGSSQIFLQQGVYSVTYDYQVTLPGGNVLITLQGFLDNVVQVPLNSGAGTSSPFLGDTTGFGAGSAVINVIGTQQALTFKVGPGFPPFGSFFTFSVQIIKLS
ncbi:hypothetical protein IC619_009095 [Hazenella sp. IB182353]|uniref:hypothetical protein n=1 Tax=Polycladospora coralii TaxID=2771432 RepID=UPI001746EBD4|nr:hypothetical protein [Polycladospora coralii]MBS7530646.1 hypothetical protein [Polycladospora coralii]